jgi:hypothetical protein
MAQIKELFNPFKPEDNLTHFHPGGITVRAWLLQRYAGFKEFSNPTICRINGREAMRAEWDVYVLKENDIIEFAVVHEGFFAFLAVTIIASVLIASMIPKPSKPGEVPAPDPVFDLKGQRNQNRLGQPIEVPYGRNQLFPSVAARAYNKYVGNEQYQYMLLSLGQGKFADRVLQIEDTPISSFQDVEYAFYEPGEQVTLFPDNVVTSTEVSSIELFGTDEGSYDGPVGGFIANPPGTLASILEIDVTLPVGLYYTGNKGGLGPLTVTALFEYRPVDDDGTPLAAWDDLFVFSKTLATTTPQRFTLEAAVAPGRYEVRGARTNAKSGGSRGSDTLRWEAMRAFLPSTKEYGGVTLLAIKARATNNLNDRASNTINVIATRMLPRWTGTEWTEPEATRSIVWAFCDVFRSAYGGRFSNSQLDLEALLALDAELTAAGKFCDWVVDQKMTAWVAATTIARLASAVPMVNGSRVTMIVDEPKTLPSAVFNQDNILADSFSWQIKLPTQEEYDGVEVEYIDGSTWRRETVLCYDPEDFEPVNPDKVTLTGCTSRQHAYTEGMRINARRKLHRESIVFSTGLEGHLPSFGDLIAVSHDLPRWGQGGQVLKIDGNIQTELATLTLSMPVQFTAPTVEVPEPVHYILLRKRDGTRVGPIVATAGSTPNKVVLGATLPDAYPLDNIHEKYLYLFGTSGNWGEHCTVTGIVPSEDKVEIKCHVYKSQVYSFDELEAPPLNNPTLPPEVPALPVVYGLKVEPLPDSRTVVLASWEPALGAITYVIQTSSNGTDWQTIGRITNTSFAISVNPVHLYVRVAGINLGAGPWATWDGDVGEVVMPPPDVDDLELVAPFVGTSVSIQWFDSPAADSYTVTVLQGATVMRTAVVANNNYTYTREMAGLDGTVARDLVFELVGTNAAGDSDNPETLTVNNPAPAAVTGMTTGAAVLDGGHYTYAASWDPNTDADLRRYQVWGSHTSGFTPDGSTLLYSGTSPNYTIIIPAPGAHAAFYWRAAAQDVWGPEVNPCAEQTIAPHA